MSYRFTDCKAKHDTGNALLVHIPDLDRDEWIAHSQIHADSEVYNDDEDSEGDLVIKDYLAEKLGVL